MAKTRLPRNGSSTDHLARALKRRDVCVILAAYLHGALSSFDVTEKFEALKVKVQADELEQLVQLALAEARGIGR